MKPHVRTVPCATALLLAGILLSGCGSPAESLQLTGVWAGEHDGRSLRFEFRPDYGCILHFTDVTTGDVVSLKGRYELDLTKRPVPLTIRGMAQLDHPLHTIVAFTDPDTIVMGKFSKRWRLRPVAFQEGAAISLVRSSEER
jgi:hypothetical protein